MTSNQAFEAARLLMATDFSRILAERFQMGGSLFGLSALIEWKAATGKHPERLIERAKQRLECLDLEGCEQALAQYRKEIEARKCGT